MKNTLKTKGKSLKLTTLGFTLIELLAVIVILAVISVIAVPIVIDIIDDAKESSSLRSLELYKKAVETAYMDYKINNQNEEITEAILKQNVEYNGEKIDCNIYWDENENIDIYNCYINDKLFENVKYTYKNQTKLNTTINGKSVNIGEEVIYKNGNSFYKDSDGNNIKWNIIGEEDGHLLILSSPIKIVPLSGKEGYQTGIDVLNNEAQHYLNENYAIEIRSVRAHDINKLTGYNPNYVPKGNGETEIFGFSNTNKLIEMYSNDVIYTNSNGIISSIPSHGVGGTISTFIDDKDKMLVDGNSIKVKNDYYYYCLDTLQTSCSSTYNSNSILDIIYPKNKGEIKYWLADKSILGKSDYISYSLRSIWNNTFTKTTLYKTDGEVRNVEDIYLRVVVKLKTIEQLKKEGISLIKYNNSYVLEQKDSNGVSMDKVCRKAIFLNTSVCTKDKSTNFCMKWGYALNEQITYGKIPSENNLSVGDAFDCDVDGDGIYSERFYYLTDLESDDSVALLIYNQNVDFNNVGSKSSAYYSEADDNTKGPIAAIEKLPTIFQWKNVSLKNSVRDIVSGTNVVVSKFNYGNKAARLLTVKELKRSCGITENDLSGVCSFLFENTKFADGTTGLYGYWLETPYSTKSARNVYSGNVNINNATTTTSSGNYGVRPLIEIPKYELDYN